jgi:hypothetical protein
MTKAVEDLVAEVALPFKKGFEELRNTIKENLPEGFEETVHGKMLYYVVPYSIYPAGYHCAPRQPLPFIALAAQKNFIAVYHMGMYAVPELLDWFQTEYPKHSKSKADMGKSCIRFKKPDQIPLGLIGDLMKKMKPEDWVKVYEKNYKKI